ncbi:MAG: RecQ family ATP-dependent DNA helicase [Rhodoferax sp.]|nr:RecQ family ATP-dependent DNA helicase [Rhodoferax sp.]
MQNSATKPSNQTRRMWIDKELRRVVPRFKSGFTCDEQADIALAYHDGDPVDVLGILPTGMGKSLCYLLPTHLWAQENRAALTVVVSPLIALMQDALDKVSEHNDQAGEFQLKVAQLNSGVDVEQRRKIRSSIRKGDLNLLFLGPETLVQPWTYEMLADATRSGALRGLVIDEAHMILEWGGEFRPDFRRIGPIRKLLQEAAPVEQPLRTLLLTATLAPDSRPQLLSALGIEDDIHEIEHKAIRAEHQLHVQKFKNEAQKLQQVVKDVRKLSKKGAGIIYCAKRDDCEQISEMLNDAGLGPARHFHGGTPIIQRQEVLRGFRKNNPLIVVATDAFGLGIDKQDVRWVLHFSMPESIDQYYQEIGRSGRDGKSSEALLYYSPADKGLAKRNKLKTLTTEKFDARLRCMRKGSLVLSKTGRNTLRLIEEQTVPDYKDADDGGPSKQALRAHTIWNYAVLVRAHELGWIELGPDIVFTATCRWARSGSLAAAKKIAPTLGQCGILGKLRVDRNVKLKLGEAAEAHAVDPRILQRELFDLILKKMLRLPDDAPSWDTRVLVTDITNRNTKLLHEDVALRLERQQAGSQQVELMAAYAKGGRCRRNHFYRAYGYDNLIPIGGCGRCDVCCG